MRKSHISHSFRHVFCKRVWFHHYTHMGNSDNMEDPLFNQSFLITQELFSLTATDFSSVHEILIHTARDTFGDIHSYTAGDIPSFQDSRKRTSHNHFFLVKIFYSHLYIYDVYYIMLRLLYDLELQIRFKILLNETNQ